MNYLKSFFKKESENLNENKLNIKINNETLIEITIAENF